MNQFKNIYIKIFVYLFVFALIMELSRLAFWLMNQDSNIAVYMGFIIALSLVIALSTIIVTVFQKVINNIKKPKNNEPS
jgi:hypothetical protein